jgi:hypothetical protein
MIQPDRPLSPPPIEALFDQGLRRSGREHGINRIGKARRLRNKMEFTGVEIGLPVNIFLDIPIPIVAIVWSYTGLSPA